MYSHIQLTAMKARPPIDYPAAYKELFYGLSHEWQIELSQAVMAMFNTLEKLLPEDERVDDELLATVRAAMVELIFGFDVENDEFGNFLNATKDEPLLALATGMRWMKDRRPAAA